MRTLGTPPRYRAFLLRCWEERGQAPEAPGAWRYSLEDPHEGRRRGFGSLAALVAALEAELMSERGEPVRAPPDTP